MIRNNNLYELTENELLQTNGGNVPEDDGGFKRKTLVEYIKSFLGPLR